MMGYTNGWIWILMFIGGLILIGIIAIIAYALIRSANTSGKSDSSDRHEMQSDGTSRALSILAERYAKGEISDDEYKQKKSEITRS